MADVRSRVRRRRSRSPRDLRGNSSAWELVTDDAKSLSYLVDETMVVVATNLDVVVASGPLVGVLAGTRTNGARLRAVFAASLGVGASLMVAGGLLVGLRELWTTPYLGFGESDLLGGLLGVAVGVAGAVTTAGIGYVASRIPAGTGSTDRRGTTDDAGDWSDPGRSDAEDPVTRKDALSHSDPDATDGTRQSDEGETTGVVQGMVAPAPEWDLSTAQFVAGVVAVAGVGTLLAATIDFLVGGVVPTVAADELETYVLRVLWAGVTPPLGVFVGFVAGLAHRRGDVWKAAAGAGVVGLVLSGLSLTFGRLVVHPRMLSGFLELPESAVRTGGYAVSMVVTGILVGTVVAEFTDDDPIGSSRFPLAVGDSPVPEVLQLAALVCVFSFERLARVIRRTLTFWFSGLDTDVTGYLIDSLVSIEYLQHHVPTVGIVAGIVYALLARGSPKRLGTRAAVGGLVGYAVVGTLSILATFVLDPPRGSAALVYGLMPLVTAPLVTGGAAVLTGLALQERDHR